MKQKLQYGVMLVCLSMTLAETSPTTAQCVATAHRDPVLGRRFVTVRNSAHPEWPSRTMTDDGEPRVTTEQALLPPVTKIDLPVIRAGQQVRLWKQEFGLQMEVSAIAEDNGSMGQKIRVRLALMPEKGQPPQEIAGIVRGAQSVEMVR